MKKFIGCLVLVVLLFGSTVYAQDVVTFAPAIEGSIMYDMQEGALVPVISLQLVTAFDGLLESRGMVMGNPQSLSELDKIGLGIGINLVTLTEKLGQQWTAKIINPTVGIAPTYNFSDKKIGIGVYAVIVKVAF